MKISELRDWATATYGAHSHKEGQFFAALGPIEEWLGHLQRHGIALELTPLGASAASALAPQLHTKDEPPALVNAGAEGGEETSLVPTVEIPTQWPPQADPVPPKEHFVGGEHDETVPGCAEGSPEAPSDFPLPDSSANS